MTATPESRLDAAGWAVSLTRLSTEGASAEALAYTIAEIPQELMAEALVEVVGLAGSLSDALHAVLLERDLDSVHPLDRMTEFLMTARNSLLTEDSP